MSGVNLNSLSTKFSVLEKFTPKSPSRFEEAKTSESQSVHSDKVDSKSKNPPKDFASELKREETSRSDQMPRSKEVSRSNETQKSTEVLKTDGVPNQPNAGAQDAVAAEQEQMVNPLQTQVTSDKNTIVPLQAQDQNASQEPILKFLDSMERELGIEPDQVLMAFASMTNEALMLPPEESTEEFVNALSIDAKQIPRVKTLYGTLLHEIADREMSMASEGKISLDTNEWNLLPKAMPLPREVEADQAYLQNSNIVKMSNKFFNVPEASELANQPSWMSKMNVKTDPSVYQTDLMTGENYLGLDEMPVNLANNFSGSDLSDMQHDAFSSADLAFEELSTESILGDENVDDMLELSGDEAIAVTDQNVPKTKLQNLAVATQPTEVINEQEPGKVEDIVQKADLLVKKGGGEVKMKLNPEGLGEVHLKVTLQEGKVDVQMVTETQQAKKAIESELQNLKAVLAEGKMDLKDIKVDVSQNLERQMQEQLADQQRENARQFLNYFRENFGSGRNAMAYGATPIKGAPSENPEDAIRTSAQQRRYNREPGRLSVVA